MFLGPANEFSTDKHHGPDGTAGVGPRGVASVDPAQ